jgi:hypothetical protein
MLPPHSKEWRLGDSSKPPMQIGFPLTGGYFEYRNQDEGTEEY